MSSSSRTDVVPESEAVERRAETSRSRSVVATLALTGIVVSLQQTLVLPLLPDLPELLDTTADNASWLVTATLLFGAVSIPTVTRLADMYGKKRMMLVTLGIMVAGSALGALSTALPFLLIARGMQGVGLALVPVGIAIMRDELPRERVPLGVALMSASLAIGSGSGLPLSGLISAHLDWHSIFWVTFVVGSVLLVAVWVVISESTVQTRGSFDYYGAAVGSFALTALMLALSKGGQWGWTSGVTLSMAIGGCLLLAVWIPMELRARNPLVNIRIAARPSVLLVNTASLMLGFATFVNMLLTPQILQLPSSSGYGLGFSILNTGLWMAPIAVAFGAMAPVSARIIRAYGPRTTLLTGSLIMAVAFVGRVYWSAELWQVVVGSVLVAIGTAMTYAAFPTLIMRAVPVTESASANGLNMLFRYVGTALASALIAAVGAASIVQVGSVTYPSFTGVVAVFWTSAGACVVSGLIALAVLSIRESPSETDHTGPSLYLVVRGSVVGPTGRPVRRAVVTVTSTNGAAIDWGQVDSAGAFAVAVPGPGRYLIITSAEGWAPESRLVDLANDSPPGSIILTERLTLSGTVTKDERSAPGAVVVLTRSTGETVGSTIAGLDGKYVLPLPSNGRYVLTPISETKTASRAVTIWGAARVVDLDIDLALPNEGLTPFDGAGDLPSLSDALS